jgi:osmotically-inducible protein OsmY
MDSRRLPHRFLTRLAPLLALSLLAGALGGCAALIVGGAAAGAGAAHDRRSFGTVIDDQNIELTAYDTLNKDKELALKNNVEIVVHNGVLLMIGETRTPELRERAEAMLRPIQGVRRIVNEIAIAEPPGLLTAANDSLLTSRAKVALFDIVDLPDFDPSRVNVSTQNSVVYLMGLVTQIEAERVSEIVRTVPGVERVVKVFEYTD